MLKEEGCQKEILRKEAKEKTDASMRKMLYTFCEEKKQIKKESWFEPKGKGRAVSLQYESSNSNGRGLY